MDDESIGELPPEQSQGGIVEQIPARILRDAEAETLKIREQLMAIYMREQAQKDSLITSKSWATVCLRDYRERIEKNREWVVPFGFFVGFGSFFFTVFTGTFTEFLKIPKDTWVGALFIAAVLALLFTIRALSRHNPFRFRRNRENLSVERVVVEMAVFMSKSNDTSAV